MASPAPARFSSPSLPEPLQRRIAALGSPPQRAPSSPAPPTVPVIAAVAAAAPTTTSAASAPLCAPAPLPGYEAALPCAELPSHGMRQFRLRAGRVDEAAVCIVSSGGALHALSDVCPHKQGELHKGDIEDSDAAHGLCVKCPRHRKKYPGGLNFAVSTGVSWVQDEAACADSVVDTTTGAAWRVPVYDVLQQSGWVYVSSLPRAISSLSAPPRDSVRSSSPPVGWLTARIVSILEVGGDAAEYTLAPSPGVEAVPQAPPGVHPHSWHISLGLMPPRVESGGEGGAPSMSTPVKGRQEVAEQPAPLTPSRTEPLSLDFIPQPPPTLHREYTPLSPLSSWCGLAGGEARLRLLVRHYASGALTSALAALRVGDSLRVSAPESTLALPALRPRARTASGQEEAPPRAGEAIGLVAGGTGIAPILQLARWALEAGDEGGAPRDMRVHLLLTSTHTPALGEAELRTLAIRHADRLRVLVTTTGSRVPLTRAAAATRAAQALSNWTITRGRISAESFAAFFPRALARVVVCGPADMNAVAAAALVTAGQEPGRIVELDA